VEPEILRRGKEFHFRVQSDWEKTAEGGIHKEHGIVFGVDPSQATHIRRGRIDLFVDELGDFVAVIEIKSTDWERVKPSNLRKLVASHCRQIWSYIEKYVDGDRIDVCPGIIYPHAPKSVGIKQEVEKYINDRCIQIVWYDDP
jgi:hypothetical protein